MNDNEDLPIGLSRGLMSGALAGAAARHVECEEDVTARLEAALAFERAHSAGLAAKLATAIAALPKDAAPLHLTGKLYLDTGARQVAMDVAYDDAFVARLRELGHGDKAKALRVA